MKKIAVIGSTGSIGLNTLRVIDAHPEVFSVVALAAKQNAELLLKQAKEFRPKLVCLYDSARAGWLEKRLKPLRIRLVIGLDGLIEASTLREAQQIIFAVVGAVGLRPMVRAIEAGKMVAVATKEPIVMGGELLCKIAARSGAQIIPIDSEHSGLWQCLEGHPKRTVKKVILTSSGGPFFRRKKSFKDITREEALNHPRWKMGPKITIDSATLMNKGLEVIEAANLFGFSADQVDVLIHPEAVVHALVEFVDGSQLAQLGVTDMRLPIQYALSYPGRIENSIPRLDLAGVGRFHFFAPDTGKFPCLQFGFEAKRAGGTMPAVLNAANEIAVNRFLDNKISFMSIPKTIERVMSGHRVKQNPTLEDILEADGWAREEAEILCRKH